MPSPPEPFPRLALALAQSPEVVRLFEELAPRADVLGRMQDELNESIIRHRAAREGRPVRFSTGQRRSLAGFDRDARQAVRELERLLVGADDAVLLRTALSGARQQIQLGEQMLPAYPADDRPMATQVLDYQRETLRLIEQFVDASPFRVKVRSIGHREG